MAELLKTLYWEAKSKKARDQYWAYLIRDLPGFLGIYLRRKWYGRRLAGCGSNLTILPGAVLLNPEKIECGDNVFIGVSNYIQAGGGLTLGSDVMLGPFSKIWTQNHVFADPERPVRLQGYSYHPVSIGRDVWVGASAFIMPGVTIGARCVVSAGAVVGAKDYPEGSILAGNPARRIGERELRWPDGPPAP